MKSVTLMLTSLTWKLILLEEISGSKVKQEEWLLLNKSPYLVNGDPKRIDVINIDPRLSKLNLTGKVTFTISIPNQTPRKQSNFGVCKPTKIYDLQNQCSASSGSGSRRNLLTHPHKHRRATKDFPKILNYDLKWYYQADTQLVYNLGEGVRLIKEELFNDNYLSLVRFYDSKNSKCFSLFLEGFKVSSFKYQISFENCKNLINAIAAPAKEDIQNLFTAFVERYGYLRVLALKEILIDGGWELELPGVEANNRRQTRL